MHEYKCDEIFHINTINMGLFLIEFASFESFNPNTFVRRDIINIMSLITIL